MTQTPKLSKGGIYTQIIIPITQRKQLQCKDVNYAKMTIAQDNCTIMPITKDKIAQRRNLCKNDNFKKDGNYSKTKTMQRQKLYKDGNYAKTTLCNISLYTTELGSFHPHFFQTYAVSDRDRLKYDETCLLSAQTIGKHRKFDNVFLKYTR